MCQCVCCDCWWMNCCGVCCAGVMDSMCFCSCWLCKQPVLEQIRPGCCICGEWTGFGNNCFCQGGMCFSPDWLKKYSAEVEAQKK